MKRTLTLVVFLLLAAAFAAAQAPSVPTCDSYNAAGAPQVAATGSTFCTDYFGVANWANSPLPSGTITGYTLISGGNGYVSPQVMITDPTGSGATATATVDPTTGAITGVSGPAVPNYTMPQVMIIDTNCGVRRRCVATFSLITGLIRLQGRTPLPHRRSHTWAR